jgi:hypothetical protein
VETIFLFFFSSIFFYARELGGAWKHLRVQMGNAETRDSSAASGKATGGVAAPSGSSYGAERTIRVELDIQKERMGKLIGTEGKTIKSIQQQVAPVKLNAPTKDDAASDEYKFVAVTLSGKANEVFKACKMVHDVATACLAVLSTTIDLKFVEHLQRPSITGIKQTIPVDTVSLPKKHDKNPKVVLEGYLEDVIKAYHFIAEEVIKGDREKKAKEGEEQKAKLEQISKRRLGGGKADPGAPGADVAGAGAAASGGKIFRKERPPRGGREGPGAPPKPANPTQIQLAGAE